MKKTAVIFLVMLSVLAAGILAVSCNSAINEEFGTVVLDFGGSERALDSNGLPILSTVRIKAEVTSSAGRTVQEYNPGREGNISLSLPVGERVVIKLSAYNASGIWSGTVTHTVEPGVNAVSVKLSKKIAGLNNLLFTQTGDGQHGYNVTLYMDGKEVKPQNSEDPYIFARDSLGRLYVGYRSTSDKTDRYTSEGDGPEPITLSSVIPVTIMNDFTKGITYVVDQNGSVYEIEENAVNGSPLTTSLTLFKGQAAIDNNRVVWVGKDGSHPTKIYAQNVGGATEPHISIKTHINIGDCKESEVTDIFIRNGYAYVLFKTVNETITGNNKALCSLGGVVRYNINNLAGDPVKIGFDNDPDFENGVLEDYDYSENFYNPVKVIGFDEDNIYIADDGFDAADTPAGARIVKNRNRIGVLNMNTNALTFTDAGPAKWYNEWKEWKAPNTKTIVWKRNASDFEYYQLDRGNEALNPPQLLTNNCKDVFCYDLDGNLYIVKNDDKISMYPQVEGAYSGNLQYTTTDAFSNLKPKSGMAVDSSASDGYKYLYYVDNSNKIKRLKWEGNDFVNASQDTASVWSSGINLGSAEPSAMAANKDGLFVASKNRTGGKYKITVQKYDKNGTPGDDSMEISSGSTNGGLRNPIVEFIHSMQILNGRLYAVSYKTVGAGTDNDWGNETKAVVSGKLLDLGLTSDELPNEPHELWSGAEEDKGYAPYRFIAVKPKELVIANDGFYGRDDTFGVQPGNQRNKVLTFSLSGTLLSEISSEAAFSRDLAHKGPSCGFIWY